MSLAVESWIEALESGEYKQASDRLRDVNGFCCLGVACDLSDAGSWRNTGEYEVVDDDGDVEAEDGVLPHTVREQLGLATAKGRFLASSLSDALRAELKSALRPPDETTTLADLNDAGVPFPLIAKVIRARPKGLFREVAP